MKAPWSIAGVTAVLALIAITVPLSAQEKIKEGAQKTKDAIVKGATVVAEKTRDGLSKTGDVMTDGWITARVHERFVGESLLKNSDISVDTRKHVVTLKGTVTSAAGRHEAVRIARETEGVKSVHDRLTIAAKK